MVTECSKKKPANKEENRDLKNSITNFIAFQFKNVITLILFFAFFKYINNCKNNY